MFTLRKEVLSIVQTSGACKNNLVFKCLFQEFKKLFKFKNKIFIKGLFSEMAMDFPPLCRWEVFTSDTEIRGVFCNLMSHLISIFIFLSIFLFSFILSSFLNLCLFLSSYLCLLSLSFFLIVYVFYSVCFYLSNI